MVLADMDSWPFQSSAICGRVEQAPQPREVVRFVRKQSLHGRGLGWIDAHLLASALVDGLQLWTADERLKAEAREFGVAYRAAS